MSAAGNEVIHYSQSQRVFLWPNGEGIGLRNQGLWVRVPPGTVFLQFCYIVF